MGSIANRILKARQYAEEKNERIRVQSFDVELQGEHDSHRLETRWIEVKELEINST